MKKYGQASLEYLITVGFVTFFIISIILVAYIYTAILRDRIHVNQVETFANKIVSAAESVFYAGEPSKTTLELHLPTGVNAIQANNNMLIVNYSTGRDNIVRAYDSKVNITGFINPAPGIKKITLEAKATYVYIHQ